MKAEEAARLAKAAVPPQRMFQSELFEERVRFDQHGKPYSAFDEEVGAGPACGLLRCCLRHV